VAYDQHLAERVRARLHRTPGIVELRMFGGWGATLHGNMAVGVLGTDLIVRVGPDRYEQMLSKPGVRPFDYTGRPMTGWVYVGGGSVRSGRALNAWVDRGVSYAASLPPKQPPRRVTNRPG
jgi:TfoX/Sxy family transcriptional regulator of competence genes